MFARRPIWYRQRISRAGHDFAAACQAEAFESFLRDQVWAVPENAPALAGIPTTMILAEAPAP